MCEPKLESRSQSRASAPNVASSSSSSNSIPQQMPHAACENVACFVFIVVFILFKKGV